MSYQPYYENGWQNGQSGETPITAEALNHMEGGVQEAVNSARGINLLDNWYFVGGGSQQGGGQFPINQRGQTSYAGDGSKKYSIDRWILYGDAALTLNEGGILLTKNSNAVMLFQEFELSFWKRLAGKEITLSALINDKLGTVSFVLPNNVSEPWDTPQLGVDGLCCDIYATYGLGIRMYSEGTSGTTWTIKAIKFELGDHQTLAHQDSNGNWVLNDPPPNFQQELAKCQRYQLVLSGNIYTNFGYGTQIDANKYYVSIPTPVTIRQSPSVIWPSQCLIHTKYGFNIAKTLQLVGDGRKSENAVVFDVWFHEMSSNTDEGLVQFLGKGGQLILDANL